MKAKLSLILASLAMAFSVGSGVAATSRGADSVDAAGNYTQTVNQYYSTSQQSGDTDFSWDLTGANLKTALYKKIKITTAGWNYDSLWTCYQTSDTRSNGTLWDIYSDDTAYTQSSPHSGTSGHSGEGDFVNREHMIPQSIFDEAAPMVSDAHHVYPSDGYINGMRSNHPHGNVSSATQTSNSGCKLGTGPTTGSTKVFEPMAKYKGDIARTYFYFVTCYENKLSTFDTFEAFSKNTYPSINSTYLAIYLQWAKDDPVDQKEIDRNNAIYKGQGNRNPFVDCPYAVGAIWDSSHASDYGTKGQYTSGDGVAISKSSASIAVNGTTTISATSSNSCNISWSSDKTNIATVSKDTASSGESIIITGVAVGTAKITASITISGTTYSQTCNVTVTAPKTLSSISVENPKTSYTVGDTFVKPTVTATFSDSSTDNVKDSAIFSNYNLSQEGNQTVSVSYTYNNVEKTTSYAITVSAASSEDEWVATALSSITSSDIFVIVGNNGSNYAMPNNATSSSPSAVSVTVEGGKITSEVADTIKWNLSFSDNAYKFYPNGSTTSWLCVTNSNTGVRVGTNTGNTFNITDNYIFNINYSRYLGIYNSTDWRCYTSINDNIKNQTFTFYKYVAGETPTPVETYSLTYDPNTTDTVNGMPTPNPLTGIESGATVQLSTSTPTRDGYTFVGWSLTSAGETITSISNITENKKVYAIWQENAQPTPSTGAVNYYKLSSGDSITSGRYIIAFYTSSYYAMNRTISSSKYSYSSLTVSNYGVTSANGSNFEFEFNVSSDGISIKNLSNNKYVAYSSSTNLAELNDPYYWLASTPTRGSFRLVSKTTNTRAILPRTGSTNRFGGYATSNITDSGEYYDIELFRGYSAEDYASEFNSNITCNVDGSSVPSFGTGYSWSKFESNYSSKLTDDQKSVLNQATYTKSGSGSQTTVEPGSGVSQNVAKCVAKYDYIVGKYNPTLSSTSAWKDFINRKPAPVVSGKIALDVLGLGSTNATAIIIVIGVVALSAIGGYVFIRKRKES